MATPTPVYIVFSEGDESDGFTQFYTNKRDAHSAAFGDAEARGDFEYQRIDDVCEYLGELTRERADLLSKLNRAMKLLGDDLDWDSAKDADPRTYENEVYQFLKHQGTDYILDLYQPELESD